MAPGSSFPERAELKASQLLLFFPMCLRTFLSSLVMSFQPSLETAAELPPLSVPLVPSLLLEQSSCERPCVFWWTWSAFLIGLYLGLDLKSADISGSVRLSAVDRARVQCLRKRPQEGGASFRAVKSPSQ